MWTSDSGNVTEFRPFLGKGRFESDRGHVTEFGPFFGKGRFESDRTS